MKKIKPQNYITKNFRQTQKLGENLASILVENRRSSKLHYNGATVILLYGDLGGGKTTFLQGLAKGLGIKQKVLSPTFVIMKKFNNFYHLDCYRLQNEKDAKELGLTEVLQNPENIVAIEWPERIKKILPKNAIKINFKFVSSTERDIIIKYGK